MSASCLILVVMFDRLPRFDGPNQLPPLGVHRAERGGVDAHGTVAHVLVRAGETRHPVPRFRHLARDLDGEFRRRPRDGSWKVLRLEEDECLGVPPPDRVRGELAPWAANARRPGGTS